MTENSSANQEQAEFWGGPRGQSWADAADRYDAQLERYALLAVGAAAPLPGETVLDVGCGTGATTFEAAAAVGQGGRAIGVDISAAMLERAHAELAERSLTNVTFMQADVQTMAPLDRDVDAVLSRFGVMFFADPVAAFTNLASLVRERGRLGFVCWGPASENDWIALPQRSLIPLIGELPPTDPSAPGPFAFSDQDRVEEILHAAGWEEVTYEDVTDSLYLGGPGSVEAAAEFVLDSTSLSALVVDVRDEARATVAEAIAPFHDGTGVRFRAHARVVRAVKVD